MEFSLIESPAKSEGDKVAAWRSGVAGDSKRNLPNYRIGLVQSRWNSPLLQATWSHPSLSQKVTKLLREATKSLATRGEFHLDYSTVFFTTVDILDDNASRSITKWPARESKWGLK